MKRLTLLTLIALLLWPTGAAEAANQFEVDSGGTLMTGLLGYYKMDSSSTSSVGTYNGVDANSPSYANAGIKGNSVTYNGSTQVTNIGDIWDTVWGTPTASVAFWIYDSHNTTTRRYFGTINGGSGGVMIEYNGNSANQLGLVKQGTADGHLFVTDNPTQNTWVHYAFVASSTGVAIYKNGSVIASNAAKTDNFIDPANTNFGIGAAYNGASAISHVDARFDEVGVWSKALTPTEVSDLYNAGAGNTIVAGGGGASASTMRVIWWFDE